MACFLNERGPSSVCRVAYALNPKKMRKSTVAKTEFCDSKSKAWTGGGLSDILTDEVEDGVQFDAFDFDAAICDQPSYNVIIHKLTEDILSNDDESSRKIRILEEYLRLNPKCVIVDPFTAVEKVISRVRVCEVLSHICDHSTIRQPKYATVLDPDRIAEKVGATGLRYPLICKPIEACGTANSHSMVVAVDASGLQLVRCPCIIQEYVDHGESFFKVYVIDKEVRVFRRSSLPDLSRLKEICERSNGDFAMRSIAFDSRYTYPTWRDFVYSSSNPSRDIDLFLAQSEASVLSDTHHESRDQVSVSGKKRSSTEDEMNGSQLATSCRHASDKKVDANSTQIRAQEISSEFGLSLFGFDVIVPLKPNASPSPDTTMAFHESNIDENSRFVVIDVNFFPSYKEVKDFPSRLRSFLREKSGFPPFRETPPSSF